MLFLRFPSVRRLKFYVHLQSNDDITALPIRFVVPEALGPRGEGLTTLVYMRQSQSGRFGSRFARSFIPLLLSSE
jgi:hypothetical protein